MKNLTNIQERIEIENYISKSVHSEIKLFYENYLNYSNLDNLNALIYRKYTVNTEFIKKLFTFIFVSDKQSEKFLQKYLDLFFNFIRLFDILKGNISEFGIGNNKLTVESIRKWEYRKGDLDALIYHFNGFKFIIQGVYKNNYFIRYTANSIFKCVDPLKDYLFYVDCDRHLPYINIINTIEEAVSCKFFEDPLLNVEQFDLKYCKINNLL